MLQHPLATLQGAYHDLARCAASPRRAPGRALFPDHSVGRRWSLSMSLKTPLSRVSSRYVPPRSRFPLQRASMLRQSMLRDTGPNECPSFLSA